MAIVHSLRSLARRVWRVALPTIVVAVAAVTCDSPTAPRPAQINITPVIDLQGLSQFAGLTVDQVRVRIIRPGPPPDTIVDRIWPFSVDSTHLDLDISVDVTGTELLDVVFDLMAGPTVVFTGTQQVSVTAGAPTPPTPVTPAFVGPGAQIGSLIVSPRDSGAAYGASVQFRVVARDSSNGAVPTFYTSWSTNSTAHTINAAGILTAGNARGTVWVYARTPTGIRDSTQITIAPVPSAIQVISGNGQSAQTGSSLSQPLVVKVIAQDGGPVVGVNVNFAATTGGGSVSPTSAATDMNGLAQTTATLGSGTGANTFTASVTGLPSVSFSGTATSGAAATLAFVVQPSNTVAGVTMAPAVQVAAKDVQGNTVTTFSGNITIAFGVNAGGGTLTGTLTQPAVNGIATFAPSVDKAAAGYTLSATAVGFASITSAAFTIAPAAAATLAIVSGNNQVGSPSAALANPLVVKVTDAFGNAVPGVTVAFAVTAGGGSVGTPSGTTAANGQASSTWTLGASGTQTVTATSAGLSGSPASFTATVSSPGSVSVSPNVVTLNALGDTLTLAATLRNAANQVIPGTFTWATRNASVVTVSASGQLTAVANGTTYVVAVESGGLRDSAQVTVLQQVATVNVTPGTRSIYLTRNFTFTASPVDGRGNAMTCAAGIVWSSTATAVATVNAAGNVTGVGLGNAQIRAACGSVIGVANIGIITPITRIAIVVDTPNAFKTDTFTMVSLGMKRQYRAIAHDTLDAVMTGVSFAWGARLNGAVARIDSTKADTAYVANLQNGFTEINATAQGFTSSPGATLNVQQVVAGVTLGSTSVCVGVGGSQGLVPHAVDANGFIVQTLVSYTFASADQAVATISASGQVTGIANGSTTVTATSGAFTSAPVTVNVSNSCAGSIFFATDTISVGRGQSAQFPILLSKPSVNPVTVNLTAPAFAHWQSPSVIIPAGQTAVNATLVGDSAGTTQVTATDGSGSGYLPDTAVARVTANMSFTSGSYGIMTTDVISTQVLLSDPSPAGGTYITFNYGTPNVASISPDPAFIPAGQLAATIQIRAVGAGTTSITPNAIGVNGAPTSFTAYPPVLTPTTGSMLLGAGQYDGGNYVYFSTPTHVAVPVTITSSDSNVATVTSPTIAAGNNYAYFTVTAKAPGTATLTYSSPGWTQSSGTSVTVSTPYLYASGGGTIYTTAGTQNVYVYSTDSLRYYYYSHNRTSSLAVQLRSSDSTVMKVIDTLVTIAPNQSYINSRVTPGGAVGSAWIVATAGGHVADSVQFTTLGPPLSFSWGTSTIGAGQEDQVYVSTPNSVTTPLAVTLTSSDSSVLAGPTTVTIPAGTNYVYFNLRGKVPGSATLVATATGFGPDTAGYIVTTPRINVQPGYQLNNFSGQQTYYIYVADSTSYYYYYSTHNRTAPLTITVRSSDTLKIKTDTLVTVPAGQSYVPVNFTPLDTGSAQIVISAVGHNGDSTSYTVLVPKLGFSYTSTTLGRRQFYRPTDLYVYTPNSRPVTVPVSLTHKQPTVDSLSSSSITVPANSNVAYYGIAGLANGVDTIIATAAGYEPDTAFIQVSTPRLTNSGLAGSATTTSPPLGVTIYAADSASGYYYYNTHYVMDTVTVMAVSSDTLVLRPTQTYFHIPAGQYYTQTTVAVTGPGTASITYSDSSNSGYFPTTTNTVSVTGPSFGIYNSTPMLGMRQSGGPNSAYVYTQNAVTSPLVISLVSTDPNVVSVPATITIPTGQNIAYFTVTALDQTGTIQVQASATGYTTATTNVQVTQPEFRVSTNTSMYTTSPATPLYVQATDANGNAHYVTENVTVTLATSAPSVAAIDSTTIVIPSGSYYNYNAKWAPGTAGTAQLTATDARAAVYKYNTGSVNVAVSTPSLSTSGPGYLGIGQYQDYATVYSPTSVNTAVTVTLSHLGTAFTSTFANLSSTPITSLTIPVNSYLAYFRIAGTAAGTDNLVASATSPAHTPDTLVTIVAAGRIDPIGNWPASLKAGDSVLVTLYARDVNQTTHNVLGATTFTLAPNASMEFRSGGAAGSSVIITQVTIPADAYYVQFYLKGLVANTTGSATITNANYSTYNNTVSITP